MIRLLINYTVTIIIGICFVYSAWAKSQPISIFADSILELGIPNWKMALFIAHSIISIEFIIGFLLLFRYYLGKKLLLITIYFVTILSFVLFYQMLFFPDIKDCGCFGSKLVLTPLQSLCKNLTLIIGCIYLYYSEKTQKSKSLIFFILISTLSIFYPFHVNSWLSDKNDVSYAFDYSMFNFKKPNDSFSLKKGKWLVGFLSTSCNHCKESIKKLGMIKLKNPHLPVHLIILSEKNNIDTFLNANNASNIPYTYTNDMNNVILLSGGKVPSFFLLKNGIVEKKTTNHKELTLYDLEKWLNN